MPLPPHPFADRPNPLDATIELAEVFQHPAAGQVGQWIDKTLHGPPSVRALGRMELLRHWDWLPADKRRMLLLLAREMSKAERPFYTAKAN